MCDVVIFIRWVSGVGFALVELASRLLHSWGHYAAARDVAALAVLPAIVFGAAIVTDEGGPDARI